MSSQCSEGIYYFSTYVACENVQTSTYKQLSLIVFDKYQYVFLIVQAFCETHLFQTWFKTNLTGFTFTYGYSNMKRDFLYRRVLV